MSSQPEVNVGLVGHVDHGKTTLTKALSGVWTDRHSEEIKRGISIRLGYADTTFYKCSDTPEPDCYVCKPECENGKKTEVLRRVSFVDAPGHETLMATMLSGACMMDGAVLVIAANETCPQPQTAEHLIALDSLDVRNVVIAQNKVDLVTKEQAKKNYDEIKAFVKGSCAENAPIIPIAAHYGANIDALIQAIQQTIPTPHRDLKKQPLLYVARSLDVNRPGHAIDTLVGGVVGGSVVQGRFRVGDQIELRPGVRKKNAYQPIITEIISINAGGQKIDEATPGGLLAFGTNLDPSITKSDNLSGNVIGHPGKLPEVLNKLSLEVHLFEKLKGSQTNEPVKPLLKGEPLMISAGSAVTLGVVTEPKKGQMDLKLPICADKGHKVALSRRYQARWHLIGYGIIK
ncbi:Translation initiation factor 2 subunit gamma [uncultured archaeon]|nr:Translation initiation factor 2 subunit gamma [uncultured archaeon]